MACRKPEPGRVVRHADGLLPPRRYRAIAVIILAIVMSVLDSTIVNIALPSIARDYQVTAAASIWLVNAYQLAILMLLLPFAALGEIVGYRRVSQARLALFTLASLARALAPTLLFIQAPNNRTIMASTPRAHSGAAGGMLSAARLAGPILGAASVAILFRA